MKHNQRFYYILGLWGLLSLMPITGCGQGAQAASTQSPAITQNDALAGTTQDLHSQQIVSFCPIEALDWGMSKAEVLKVLNQQGLTYQEDGTSAILIYDGLTAYGQAARSALLNFTTVLEQDIGLTRVDVTFDADKQSALETVLNTTLGEMTTYSGYPAWVSPETARDYDTSENIEKLEHLFNTKISFEYGAMDGLKEGYYTLDGNAPLYLVQLYDSDSQVPEEGTLLCTMDRTFGNIITLIDD